MNNVCNKLDKVAEVEKFLWRQKLPILTQEEIENLTRSIRFWINNQKLPKKKA